MNTAEAPEPILTFRRNGIAELAAQMDERSSSAMSARERTEEREKMREAYYRLHKILLHYAEQRQKLPEEPRTVFQRFHTFISGLYE
jgi:hypothetical protein